MRSEAVKNASGARSEATKLCEYCALSARWIIDSSLRDEARTLRPSSSQLPTHGTLTYDSGIETIELGNFNQFNPYGNQIPEDQYAARVVAFSSAWYNAEGHWGSHQIIGPPIAEVYADSPEAWCPER